MRSNQCSDLGTGEAAYQCPDQSSADHYTQAAMQATAYSFQVGVRLTDSNNFIGARHTPSSGSNNWEMYKRAAGTFTSLGTSTASFSVGDILRVEASGNSIEAFKNGVSIIGPVTESFNNTETRQGNIPRYVDTYDPWADDFEAAVISTGGGGLSIPVAMASYRQRRTG